MVHVPVMYSFEPNKTPSGPIAIAHTQAGTLTILLATQIANKAAI